MRTLELMGRLDLTCHPANPEVVIRTARPMLPNASYTFEVEVVGDQVHLKPVRMISGDND
jgi:hypothetical protein